MNQLLCTFTPRQQIIVTLRSILDTYDIIHNKIFIYENTADKQQILCTYNIDGILSGDAYLPNTISIHRKKNYNVLYTINALNELIKEINNGVYENNYQIDWEVYKNHAILITNNQLRKIQIKFNEIIFTNKQKFSE